MKRQTKAAFLLGLLAASAPSLAGAQVSDTELEAKLPNVLLLVDTSGSMEYKVGFNASGSPVFPNCAANEKSRWIDLIEVLTGTIPNYSCQAVDRSSGAFLTEYSLPPSAIPPLDYQYRNPYHRPLQNNCTLGPDLSAIDANAYKWSPPKQHDVSGTSVACSSAFTQNGDGIIDSFGSSVRFGLMTFDTMPDASTGVSGTSPDYPAGLLGAWSYYVAASPDSPHAGNPVMCTSAPMEVGARNPAALPWEGKMIPFGAQSQTSAENDQRHDYIRKVLLTTRPYGATPIAGMLDDAYDFLTLDSESDPDKYIAPQVDGFVAGECRKQYVILLTDGEPNLDLRTECEDTTSGTPPGVCPYEEPEKTAALLYAAGITTYVVGFSPTDINPTLQCDQFAVADLSAGGKCFQTGLTADEQRQLNACCNMQRIAFEGSGGKQGALFANDPVQLRASLDDILNDVLKGTVRSRTRPTWARGGDYMDPTAPGVSFRFLSGLEASNTSKQLWSGKLERQRFSCNNGVPTAEPIEESKGDDFIANVNALGPSERTYYTFVSTDAGYKSERTVRPGLTTDPDGLGSQTGSDVHAQGAGFLTQVPASVMNVDESQANCSGLTDSDCAERVLNWTIGFQDSDATITPRWAGAGADEEDNQLIADIHHSTPRVVDHPDAIIQDESYGNFAEAMKKRSQMLYVSSNDGFLHGFKVRPNDPTVDPVKDKTNNEEFAYIPPAVLTRLQTQFGGAHQRLLDGEPIVKDVIATEASSGSGSYVFERTAASAHEGGQSTSNTWRTVLVQSFGEAWPGYFAVDITEAGLASGNGPRLLWQITTAANGDPLFGKGGTPLITTVFDGDKEIAVAVLPGGSGGSPTGAAAPRYSAAGTGTYAPRSQVNTWDASAAPSRSLTIVRLDNGQILRTFRVDGSIAAALGAAGMTSEQTAFSDVTTDSPQLDSPITGRPVAFPADTGAVADRIFVGDQDGTLWRVDVSEPKPEDWTMDLFFDAYTLDGTNPSTGALMGQPIATPPILSVDERGNITVNFSTGDQEAIDVGDTTNYLWSLTENIDKTTGEFTTSVNWYQKFEPGERVTGPMVLLQGDLYFSTFTPNPPSSGCGGGDSKIRAYNYLRPKTPGAPDDGEGGEAVPSTNGDPEFLITVEDSVVFGVTVGQQPSCNSAGAGDTTSSPYFGSYTKSTNTVAAPGALQLMFHTTNSTLRDSTTGSNDVGVATSTVRTPPSISRISSWAALVE